MRRLNILMTFPWLSLGGGQNTTISLATGLTRRGHKVVYASEGGVLVERLQREGIRHYRLPFNKFMPELLHVSIDSLTELSRIVRAEEIDVIHSYHPQSFIICYLVSLLLRIPIVNTHLHKAQGYPIPWFKGKVICVAPEFKNALAPRYKSSEELIVIRNRINLERCRSLSAANQIVDRCFLGNGHRVVMMSRLDGDKIGAILHLIRSAEYILKAIPDVEILVVGDGDHFDRVDQAATEANSRLGKKAIIMAGAVTDPMPLLHRANVVLGIGRCAIEGMACAKPTVIVGENGFAGIVEPTTVETLGYYNFAGRNVTTPVNPRCLADAVVKILNDRGYAERIGTFSQEYVIREFDADLGAEKLEKIYYDLIDKNEPQFLSRVRGMYSLGVTILGLFLFGVLRAAKKKMIDERASLHRGATPDGPRNQMGGGE